MEIACDNIDKLINIEMRRTGLPRGKKWVLWEVARELSPEPLILAAARLLNREASDIAIVTGAAVPGHMPVGENDGPFGSVVLATALVRIGSAAPRNRPRSPASTICSSPSSGSAATATASSTA